MNDPIRDCPHGHMKGKCDTCELITAEARIEALETWKRQALEVMTRWESVYEATFPNPPGKHLGRYKSDCVKARIKELEAIHRIGNEGFEEWWPSVGQLIGKVAAKAAWDYQQTRIKELEAGLDEAIYLLGLDKQPPLIPSEQRIIDARRGGGE